MKYRIIETTSLGEKYFKVQVKKYFLIWCDVCFYWNEVHRPFLFTSINHAEKTIATWGVVYEIV